MHQSASRVTEGDLVLGLATRNHLTPSPERPMGCLRSYSSIDTLQRLSFLIVLESIVP